MSRPATGRSAPGGHRQNPERPENQERGAGTVLALGLGMLVVLAAVLIMLLAQAGALAFRAAAAADLAALAAADAARGITPGEPCAVAADVARRNGARVLSCSEGTGSTVQVRTELEVRTPVGGATGLARAGPPP
ncbi:flp pilus-assembly TadE/G-like family protein [Arthrobacter sp. OVS8]|nr:flp pilus-assembly TadE/G-like family protein [Arthrobacter sp. OVS8]